VLGWMLRIVAALSFPSKHLFPNARKIIDFFYKEIISESLLENLDIIYAVSKGKTAEEIVKYAQENQIDLIVVGHKYRGKLYPALFDSTTDVNIIDKALLPVLVIPEK
jgi:nucleotide-binding universal stress UspA family protein